MSYSSVVEDDIEKNKVQNSSFISLLLKKINIEGGDIKKALSSVVAKNYVETQEYDIHFDLKR